MILGEKETGIGFFLSIAQNVVFFCGVPVLAKYYWPAFLKLREEIDIDIYPYMVAYVTI